ncbi:MAG TPA: response regulator transcription factor [Chloroflexota bacterium]|nr:response regulator transcription factor [Chloroflexota bacterium]
MTQPPGINSHLTALLVGSSGRTINDVADGLRGRWRDLDVQLAHDRCGALALLQQLQPDVALLEVGTPASTAIALVQDIRHRSDVPLLLIAPRLDERDQVRALDLGADDYVVRPFSLSALAARVNAVVRRSRLAPSTRRPDFVADDLGVRFSDATVTISGQPVHLTPMEYRLLYYLIRRVGQVISHEVLLEALWGREYGATTHHLKVFVNRLRTKLKDRAPTRMIQTVRGRGYRFRA